MTKKIIIIVMIALAIVFIVEYVSNQNNQAKTQKVDQPRLHTPSAQTGDPKKDIEILSQQLDIPWEIVFLPNGDYLITQRPGTLLLLNKNGTKTQQIQGVTPTGEGGLLGLTLHPEFSANRKIYLYMTYNQNNELANKVEQYTLNDAVLSERKVIIDGIRGSAIHDGGRIAFGPDKMLYVTTGDAGQTKLAQDTNSLNGKILRITDEGNVPADNPFNNEIYSYGHRNAQGITWDEEGNLWATEHGPSGLQTGYDELNKITKGGNYGWPDVRGDEKKDGTIAPIIHSGSSETWAPSGAVYYKNNIYFTGLRGETIYKAELQANSTVTITTHFPKEFGRIRTITLGPDNNFYILTNNTDGRGIPKENDDKLIRINPELLQ